MNLFIRKFTFKSGLPLYGHRFTYTFRIILIKGSSIYLKQIDEPFLSKMKDSRTLNRLGDSPIIKGIQHFLKTNSRMDIRFNFLLGKVVQGLVYDDNNFNMDKSDRILSELKFNEKQLKSFGIEVDYNKDSIKLMDKSSRQIMQEKYAFLSSSGYNIYIQSDKFIEGNLTTGFSKETLIKLQKDIKQYQSTEYDVSKILDIGSYNNINYETNANMSLEKPVAIPTINNNDRNLSYAKGKLSKSVIIKTVNSSNKKNYQIHKEIRKSLKLLFDFRGLIKQKNIGMLNNYLMSTEIFKLNFVSMSSLDYELFKQDDSYKMMFNSMYKGVTKNNSNNFSVSKGNIKIDKQKPKMSLYKYHNTSLGITFNKTWNLIKLYTNINKDSHQRNLYANYVRGISLNDNIFLKGTNRIINLADSNSMELTSTKITPITKEGINDVLLSTAVDYKIVNNKEKYVYSIKEYNLGKYFRLESLYKITNRDFYKSIKPINLNLDKKVPLSIIDKYVSLSNIGNKIIFKTDKPKYNNVIGNKNIIYNTVILKRLNTLYKEIYERQNLSKVLGKTFSSIYDIDYQKYVLDITDPTVFKQDSKALGTTHDFRFSKAVTKYFNKNTINMMKLKPSKFVTHNNIQINVNENSNISLFKNHNKIAVYETNKQDKWLDWTERWWFIKPTNDIMINIEIPSIDYPYETEGMEIMGEKEHPIPEFKYQGLTDIKVSMDIVVELVNIIIHWWSHSYKLMYSAFGWEIMQGLFRVINKWMKLEDSKQKLSELEGAEEQYNRVIRWIRWEAEKMYWMSKSDDNQGKVEHGNYYMEIFVKELLDYLDLRYYTILPLFNVNNTEFNKMDDFRGINHNPQNDILPQNFKINKVDEKRTNFFNNDDNNLL